MSFVGQIDHNDSRGAGSPTLPLPPQEEQERKIRKICAKKVSIVISISMGRNYTRRLRNSWTSFHSFAFDAIHEFETNFFVDNLAAFVTGQFLRIFLDL